MILYYAIGGGLGHLTRARAVIHTLGLGTDVAVVTASRFAADPRVMGPASLIAVQPELANDPPAFARWLRATTERTEPEAIYIDAFPAGILGELGAFAFPAGVPVFHVARLLRWERYREILTSPLPRFECVYITEPLTGDHESALRASSSRMQALELRDPPCELDRAVSERLRGIASAGAPLWLVLHSGPAREVHALLAYADRMAADERVEPQIVVASRSAPVSLPVRVIHLDIYPAVPVLPLADRIITGCGFNAMRQAAPWRERHRFMPFERRYDDQELRAARYGEPVTPVIAVD